ncbi:propanediol utilization protein [Secundilactobacillus silagincola]|jgi:microcompartment protein PduM|uniref:Propanediol utilization protein n=1 Tax=Secundilactobacillus silagincola TaxID=1714681 RepID=A0A1Z5J0Y0_9LACO|nr:PduM family microcompartment protein [Secundilactobacillus silagincola]GAX07472.1 propanediol utilization protein [Secundilactobacillus silagincola]
MDHLIEQVLTKIRQREHQSFEVDYLDRTLPPDDKVFTDFANVSINDVTIDLLIELYRVNTTNSWIHWILQGISFQVNFTFNISQYMVNFIPKKMLLDWPVKFVVDKERPVVTFNKQTVSRGDVAGLPDKAVLVVTDAQSLTTEAKEVSRLKQITIQIRTDEDCIWQK